MDGVHEARAAAITRRAATWQTHTVVAALRAGLGASAVFDGPIDNESFLAYVEQILVPTLQPGAIVVLDNLVIHKQPAVRAAIEPAARDSSAATPT